jgi:uncharacterized membrane protein YhaH (DUF805 family)
MKGSVIGFDSDTNTGAISGYDGRRYDFAAVDWHGNRQARPGDLVDFAPAGQRATQIYLVEPEYVPPSLGQFLFSLEGRISRSQLWLRWFVPLIAISLVLLVMSLFAAAADSAAAGTFLVIWLIFSLVTVWPDIAVMVKRIHDRNKTGWLVLAYWIPAGLQLILFFADASDNAAGSILDLITGAVAIWFLIEFGCMRGTVGTNQYGPDPAPPR